MVLIAPSLSPEHHEAAARVIPLPHALCLEILLVVVSNVPSRKHDTKQSRTTRTYGGHNLSCEISIKPFWSLVQTAVRVTYWGCETQYLGEICLLVPVMMTTPMCVLLQVLRDLKALNKAEVDAFSGVVADYQALYDIARERQARQRFGTAGKGHPNKCMCSCSTIRSLSGI